MASGDWTHGFAKANGLRVHYVTAGEGPLVLLLHGFPQYWYAWRKQIPALAARFRVVAPDLRGYGDTDKPGRARDYAAASLVEDTASLIAALGEKKARVVGHDWGGAVAWLTALERPEVVERLAVLNCPHPAVFARALRSNPSQMLRSWYMLFFQLPGLPERALLRRDAQGLRRLFLASSARGVFTREDLDAYAQAAARPGALTAALNYYRAAFRSPRAMLRASDPGRKISAPTLLIWGEEDRALGKELTLGMEPLFTGPFRLVYVPGAGHWVNEERPDLVNAALADFL